MDPATTTPQPVTDQPKSGLARKVAGLMAWLVLLLLFGWATMALYYSPLPEAARLIVALAFALGSALLLIRSRPRWKGLLAFGVLFIAVLVWWLLLPPSNKRDWQSDVAVLPHATFAGNEVTIHDIRNCVYKSENEYQVRHYDHTYDLARLQSADLFLVYWGSPLICHTMVSFGFEGGDYLCISIETRKEKGEGYSAIKGFFKQYELTYVVADERDLVGLRTNFRHEDVYLYRLQSNPDLLRKVFLNYVAKVNSLHDHAEWYNAFAGNCTTNIRQHTRPYTTHHNQSWKVLINGFIDEFIYANGALDQSLPLAQLKKSSHINQKAQAADLGADFSSRIREGLPGIKPRSR